MNEDLENMDREISQARRMMALKSNEGEQYVLIGCLSAMITVCVLFPLVTVWAVFLMWIPFFLCYIKADSATVAENKFTRKYFELLEKRRKINGSL